MARRLACSTASRSASPCTASNALASWPTSSVVGTPTGATLTSTVSPAMIRSHGVGQLPGRDVPRGAAQQADRAQQLAGDQHDERDGGGQRGQQRHDRGVAAASRPDRSVVESDRSGRRGTGDRGQAGRDGALAAFHVADRHGDRHAGHDLATHPAGLLDRLAQQRVLLRQRRAADGFVVRLGHVVAGDRAEVADPAVQPGFRAVQRRDVGGGHGAVADAGQHDGLLVADLLAGREQVVERQRLARQLGVGHTGDEHPVERQQRVDQLGVGAHFRGAVGIAVLIPGMAAGLCMRSDPSPASCRSAADHAACATGSRSPAAVSAEIPCRVTDSAASTWPRAADSAVSVAPGVATCSRSPCSAVMAPRTDEPNWVMPVGPRILRRIGELAGDHHDAQGDHHDHRDHADGRQFHRQPQVVPSARPVERVGLRRAFRWWQGLRSPICLRSLLLGGAKGRRVHPSVHLAAKSWSTVNRFPGAPRMAASHATGIGRPVVCIHAAPPDIRPADLRGFEIQTLQHGCRARPVSRGAPFTCTFPTGNPYYPTKRAKHHEEDRKCVALCGSAPPRKPPNARKCATRWWVIGERSSRLSWFHRPATPGDPIDVLRRKPREQRISVPAR